jgi:PA14 domain
LRDQEPAELDPETRAVVERLRALAKDSHEIAELLFDHGRFRVAASLAKEALDHERRATRLTATDVACPDDLGPALEAIEARLTSEEAVGRQDVRALEHALARIALLVKTSDPILRRAVLGVDERRAQDRLRRRLRPALAVAALLCAFPVVDYAWRWLTGGLRADYFLDPGFERLLATRVESNVDFEYVPDRVPKGLPSGEFSIRWHGSLQVPADDQYTFVVRSDDGARLFVDDRLVLDAWHDQEARDRAATTWLSRGGHGIRLEYYQGSGHAACRLWWMRSGGLKEDVPRRLLRPD